MLTRDAFDRDAFDRDAFDRAKSFLFEFGRPLVNSCFTLALVTGISVPGVSENAVANLGWESVKLPHPVFEGDTIYARSEVLEARASRSRPSVGIVRVRTTGYNQAGATVIEFERAVMVYRRGAAPTRPGPPDRPRPSSTPRRSAIPWNGCCWNWVWPREADGTCSTSPGRSSH